MKALQQGAVEKRPAICFDSLMRTESRAEPAPTAIGAGVGAQW